MYINKNHEELIHSVIKESYKFKGNEELIDIITEAVYNKSYLLIDAIKDISRLRRHLRTICDSCFDQILKEKQKFEELKACKENPNKNAQFEKNVVSVKKMPDEKELLEEKNKILKAQESLINLKEEIQRSEKYDTVDSLIDPLEFCPKKQASATALEKLIKIVKNIDSKNPNKKYYEIFFLRYINKLSQHEIARELKVSQAELSKRFVELVKLTRESIG